MTELQNKEFELLKVFIEICDKLNLKYYLVCGSALGAVKYGGFIPWDDDVDVALSRNDYDMFCKEAHKFLPESLFLQNFRTDPEFPGIYSKLRDSNTTYIEKSSRNLDINHGIYIDIFPLDGYPSEVSEQKRLESRKTVCKLKQLSSFEGDYSLKVRLLRGLMRFAGVHKRAAKNSEKLEKIISAYPAETSEIWCNHGNWQGKLEYAPREQYGAGVMMKFEGLDVRVPEKYDEYLTQKYGDWRAELPPEKQVGHHYYELMDVSRSYRHYIGKK